MALTIVSPNEQNNDMYVRKCYRILVSLIDIFFLWSYGLFVSDFTYAYDLQLSFVLYLKRRPFVGERKYVQGFFSMGCSTAPGRYRLREVQLGYEHPAPIYLVYTLDMS